jgi:hypothetical protein
MILMATLTPVSTCLPYLTFAKVPSPRVFPISYFPIRVRTAAGALIFLSCGLLLVLLPLLSHFHLDQNCAGLMSSCILKSRRTRTCSSTDRSAHPVKITTPTQHRPKPTFTLESTFVIDFSVPPKIWESHVAVAGTVYMSHTKFQSTADRGGGGGEKRIR